MFVELRRNLQTIIPKRVAADLGLEVGDQVAIAEEDGVVLVIPEEKSIEEKRGAIMIVELRRNLQIIIPRQIANDLDLQIGDLFDVVEEDGVIKLVPVVVYTKAEAQRLERLASEARTPGHASGASIATPPAPEPEPAAAEPEPEPAPEPAAEESAEL